MTANRNKANIGTVYIERLLNVRNAVPTTRDKNKNLDINFRLNNALKNLNKKN